MKVQSPMERLPNLTGLRFLLAFMVVVFHIPTFCENRGFPFFNDMAVFQKGHEAVCMFFSLSGFLIIRQLFIEKSQTQTIFLRSFFIRRILRIFPLYYLVLTFGFLYYRIILPYLGFDYQSNYDLWKGILLSYTFFPNIFATYSPGGIIEILWSIGIEEQFYLLIAPLIYFLPFKWITRFLLFFTTLYCIVFFSGSADFLKGYNMLFFYFSFSGFCSILSLNNTLKLQKLRYLLFILLLVYFTTSLFKNHMSYRAYEVFSMLLFGLAISGLAEKRTAVLDNKPLNYLGKITYGIYMYHAILMQGVGLLFLKSNIHLKIPNLASILLFNVLVFGTTILTAHISYNYFESYFLNLKKKLRINN